MMILKTSRSNLSSNDQLSLDLPFAATKSLAARVGPTPTFTRGSGATYIGSDGLIHGVDTSTTSNTIGTGSRTFTLAATAGQDQFWRTGDAVEASNGSNSMVGTVTGYNAATQVLVCNMTSTGGSGTFTAWRIGYRGPRFDHTSAGACRGLLIEESRTNLLQRSEEFGDTYWEKVRATISADQTASPTGETTADKLINDTTASNNHRVDRGTLSLNLNTVYTVSVFAKASEYSGLALGVDPSSPTTGVQFSLSGSGSVTAQNAGYTGTIQNFGNGWFRCTATFTSSSTVPNHRLYMYVGQNGTTFSYTGDGTSGIFIWGVQLEAGSFPTSYIPTTTASVVRSADVCSITGANFTSFYNQPEGTFLSNSSQPFITTANAQVYASDNGSDSTRFNLRHQTSFAVAQIGGVTQSIITFGSPTANAVSKIAYSYANANYGGARNGTLGASIPNLAIPTVDRIFIGSKGHNSSEYLNGHIAAIRYYKKRLPNAKLVTLTT
jgi:hypothetical protein